MRGGASLREAKKKRESPPRRRLSTNRNTVCRALPNSCARADSGEAKPASSQLHSTAAQNELWSSNGKKKKKKKIHADFAKDTDLVCKRCGLILVTKRIMRSIVSF